MQFKPFTKRTKNIFHFSIELQLSTLFILSALSTVFFDDVALSYLPTESADPEVVIQTFKQESKIKQPTESVTNKVAGCIFGICIETPSILDVGTELIKKEVYTEPKMVIRSYLTHFRYVYT